MRFVDHIRIRDDAEFESKHKRDRGGKFTSGSSENTSFNEEEYNKLIGKEFKGVRRRAAVRKLLEEKQGHVKDAFYREEIGYIDLIWGNDSVGLCHIIKRRTRNNPNINIVDFAEKMSDVIQNGEIHFCKETNNYEIWYQKKLVVVTKTFHGKEQRIVITEFPSRKKPTRFNA